MHYEYYQYCQSLIFEFWLAPLQVEYGALVRSVAASACHGCGAHMMGSVLYVTALAALGTLAKLVEIYMIIGDHEDLHDEEYHHQKQNSTSASNLRRDLRLTTSTVSALVYVVMLLGVQFVQPLLFVPWILFQLLYIGRALYACIRIHDASHTELQLIALSGNNLIQVLCVFLGFLRLCR